MTDAAATLNDHRVTSAHVSIPAWGRWWADVDVDGEHELAGSVTLKVADLTLVGSVLSGGPREGRSHFCVVAGKGGWGRTIPARGYANDAEVKASLVLQDAADACGETILASTLPTKRLGPSWARREGPACRVLEQVVPGGWYVGEDGITRIGARPASALAVSATLGPVDRARGTVTLAAESIASILPGIVVEGLSAVDVLHEIGPKGLRSTIWGSRGGGSSRALAAMRAIFEQLDPDRAYRGVTEYRVTSLSGDRMNLEPVRVSTGMPTLTRVKARPGLPGCKGAPKLGCRVLVGFVEASPARPYVAAYEDSEGDGYLATSLNLLNGSNGVARVGDSVSITLVNVQPAGPGPATATGTIATGSSKVKAG